ncbi:N-acetylgalactosamine 6-sulfate sulfatase, partial [bacterium]|nr:N-acetylgalactosamine 6-sulfate sulfatase [bacterium]
YEGGLKVPTAVVWPGKIEAGQTTEFQALSMDFCSTILDVAGVEQPSDCDGRSILPTLLGNEQKPLRDLSFFRRREGGIRYNGKTIEAVIRGDWKLLQNTPFEPLELYNLKQDPLEQNNLVKKAPRIYNELAAALRREIQRYGQIPWQKPEADNPAAQ